MNKKIISIFMVGVLSGCLLASLLFSFLVRNQNRNQAGGAHRTVLKVAHGLDQNYPVLLAMQPMAESLDKKSEGTIELQIFPNGRRRRKQPSKLLLKSAFRCLQAPLDG